ncbi:MAG: TolC family protein [Verrucomicrobiae bacterium]|nr:TolC family protein [Verrucomicrobiae bacterium]
MNHLIKRPFLAVLLCLLLTATLLALASNPRLGQGNNPHPLVAQATEVAPTRDLNFPAEATVEKPAPSATPAIEPPAHVTPAQMAPEIPVPKSTQAEISLAESGAEFVRLPLLKKQNLSLAAAVGMALKNNFDIRISQLNPEIEAMRLTQAWGAFDPALGFGGGYESIDTPQNTQEFVSTGGTVAELNQLNGNPRIFRDRNWKSQASLSGKLPLGTEYEFKMTNNSLRNTLNQTSPLSLYSPEFASFSGLTITQPLLRGFGTDINLTEVRIARVNRRIATHSLQLALIKNIGEVMKCYYDLVYSFEDIKVKEQAVELSKNLLEENRRQLEKGLRSPIELSTAEVALAENYEELLLAYNAMLEKQTALKKLIWSEYSDRDLHRAYVPLEMPDPTSPVLKRDDLLSQAFQNRPEYLQALEEAQREKIRLHFAENQTWPKLDLKSTIGYSGMADNYGGTLDDAFDSQAPQWSVGLAVTIPLGNNEAIGRRDAAAKTKEQAVLKVKQSEVNTMLEVDAALQAIDTNRKRVETTRRTRQLAQDNLESEVDRLEKGTSSSINVLKFQRDLSQARSRELGAAVDLQKSLVQLWQANGTLLQKQNISLTPDPERR